MLTIFKTILLSILFILSVYTQTIAGDWRVIPIRVDLDMESRSGSVRLLNSDTEVLRLQVSGSSWTQSGEDDVYSPTDDLIFFPKILKIPAGEERVLRVGINWNPGEEEKTYRLFIEEIPAPSKDGASHVSVAVRFGLPIFVAPRLVEKRGEIAQTTIEKNEIVAVVENKGNVNLKALSIIFTGVDINGKETFTAQAKPWYILEGGKRTFNAEIPQGVCDATSEVRVAIQTDKIALKDKISVTGGCP